jgi:hypothetical protein
MKVIENGKFLKVSEVLISIGEGVDIGICSCQIAPGKWQVMFEYQKGPLIDDQGNWVIFTPVDEEDLVPTITQMFMLIDDGSVDRWIGHAKIANAQRSAKAA